MTMVGLVGGLGPESTIDYYRRILDAWQRQEPSTAPSIVIDSLDVQRALRLVASDRPALIEYLLASIRRLAGAGVDFVAMTANTPHIVFDDLASRSPVPLLSIVETCAAEARRRGLRLYKAVKAAPPNAAYQNANFSPRSMTRASFAIAVIRPKVGEDCVAFGNPRLPWLRRL